MPSARRCRDTPRMSGRQRHSPALLEGGGRAAAGARSSQFHCCTSQPGGLDSYGLRCGEISVGHASKKLIHVQDAESSGTTSSKSVKLFHFVGRNASHIVAMHGASVWGANLFPLDRIRLQHALRSHAWPAASPSLQHPSLAARPCDGRLSEAHAPQSEQHRRRGRRGIPLAARTTHCARTGCAMPADVACGLVRNILSRVVWATRLTQLCRCALNVLSRAHQATARRQPQPPGAATQRASVTHLRRRRGRSGPQLAAVVVEARAAAEDGSRCSQ